MSVQDLAAQARVSQSPRGLDCPCIALAAPALRRPQSSREHVTDELQRSLCRRRSRDVRPAHVRHCRRRVRFTAADNAHPARASAEPRRAVRTRTEPSTAAQIPLNFDFGRSAGACRQGGGCARFSWLREQGRHGHERPYGLPGTCRSARSVTARATAWIHPPSAEGRPRRWRHATASTGAWPYSPAVALHQIVSGCPRLHCGEWSWERGAEWWTPAAVGVVRRSGSGTGRPRLPGHRIRRLWCNSTGFRLKAGRLYASYTWTREDRATTRTSPCCCRSMARMTAQRCSRGAGAITAVRQQARDGQFAFWRSRVR